MFATANAIINDEKLLHTLAHTRRQQRRLGEGEPGGGSLQKNIKPFGIVLQINMKRAKREPPPVLPLRSTVQCVPTGQVLPCLLPACLRTSVAH